MTDARLLTVIAAAAFFALIVARYAYTGRYPWEKKR